MHRAILRLSLFLLVFAALLIAGCTDDGATTGPQTAATTLPTTLPTTEPTEQATTLQTPVPSPITPYTPEYQAGDLLASPGGAERRLITAVNTTDGTYRLESVLGSGDDAYVPYGNGSRGTWTYARAFDGSGVVQERIVMQIPVKDATGDVTGGLIYDTPAAMRPVDPSPQLLTGEVDYVLAITYTGEVRIYAELDGISPSEWTATIDGYEAFPLGTGRGAYVTVKKAAPVSGVLHATLVADGVVVDESENDSPRALLSLSFTTQ
ncbi:hypothetical protein FGU65_13085 [Methanoculleus sp. FWC-SCC1]|uniref:Bacterial spore germination immunoglobulin-like domain-containing protein n=1 Tax=Methanoculleus frigidifontis TaxID=2584085 RepID=A0ABT8MD31_9EURY|nr:hypothetical protein [Methanoculleus sp. FWC-SCC1]MDN7025801.1 hypothetical protein [Methanoculleus sp. FWC-SCC1]